MAEQAPVKRKVASSNLASGAHHTKFELLIPVLYFNNGEIKFSETSSKKPFDNFRSFTFTSH